MPSSTSYPRARHLLIPQRSHEARPCTWIIQEDYRPSVRQEPNTFKLRVGAITSTFSLSQACEQLRRLRHSLTVLTSSESSASVSPDCAWITNGAKTCETRRPNSILPSNSSPRKQNAQIAQIGYSNGKKPHHSYACWISPRLLTHLPRQMPPSNGVSIKCHPSVRVR